MLSGLLLLLIAFWGRYAFNRLWQQSLSEEAAAALSASGSLGLSLRPPAYRPRLVAEGRGLDGGAVRVEWRGGVWGAHSVLVRAGRRRERLPLLTTESALREALSR